MTATLDRPVQIAPPALELRGVGKTFGAGLSAVTALRDIARRRPGEFVCSWHRLASRRCSTSSQA
jgi:hypothetical protein